MVDVNFTVTDREGSVRPVTAKTGDVLMQVLRDKIDLTLGTCGGAISCGTCEVRLSPEWLSKLPPPSEFEAEMLDALDAQADARLSCQVVLDPSAEGQKADIVPK